MGFFVVVVSLLLVLSVLGVWRVYVCVCFFVESERSSTGVNL